MMGSHTAGLISSRETYIFISLLRWIICKINWTELEKESWELVQRLHNIYWSRNVVRTFILHYIVQWVSSVAFHAYFRWLNEKLLNSARCQQKQGSLLPSSSDVCPFLPYINWSEASFVYFKCKVSSLLNKGIESPTDVHAYGISIFINALFLHVLFINAHLRMK